MSSKKTDFVLTKVNTPINGPDYQGRNSCQSCRHINYNGSVCGQQVSPLYGQKINAEKWCRYWSPSTKRNINL